MVMTASSCRSPPGTTAGVAGRRDSRTSSLTHVALAQVREENISLTTTLSWWRSRPVELRVSCDACVRDGSADRMGRRDAQVRGGLHLREPPATSTFRALNWSTLKNVANFGTKNGPAYQDWVSDVKTATEQVDELMVHVIEWIDRQNTLEDVTQNSTDGRMARVTTTWTWSGR